MDNKIIDGKLISDQIKKEIAAEVADIIHVTVQKCSFAITAKFFEYLGSLLANTNDF